MGQGVVVGECILSRGSRLGCWTEPAWRLRALAPSPGCRGLGQVPGWLWGGPHLCLVEGGGQFRHLFF